MGRLVERFARAGVTPRLLALALRREHLTADARRVVTAARQEALGLGHAYIGPEHLLLGLLAVPGTVTARALESQGVTAKAVRGEILRSAAPGAGHPARRAPLFTPEGKKVIELSADEVLAQQDDAVAPEHVLLAILRHRTNVACEILDGLGADEQSLRRTVSAARAP